MTEVVKEVSGAGMCHAANPVNNVLLGEGWLRGWPSCSFGRDRAGSMEASAKAMPELPNAPDESMASSDRFFPATILGGHLHVRRDSRLGAGDSARFEWADEEFVDMLLSKNPTDRKARTREELEAIMKEPKRAPTREVWMHESLVDEAANCGRRWRLISNAPDA